MDVSEQHQGGTFIQISIDALQEFSVQQSPHSAEFNRGGGFFNATTIRPVDCSIRCNRRRYGRKDTEHIYESTADSARTEVLLLMAERS